MNDLNQYSGARLLTGLVLSGAMLLAAFHESASAAVDKAAPAKKPVAKAKVPVTPPAPLEPAPAAVLNPANWKVADIKYNTFSTGEWGGKPAIAATGKSLLIVSPEKLAANSRVRALFRFTDAKQRSGVTFACGLADPADTKVRGNYVTVTPGTAGVTVTAFDPNSPARTPETRVGYRPVFQVERSLSWPESLRANVEADMVASKPMEQRLLTLDIVVREHGYDLAIDGIPLTSVNASSVDNSGFARLIMTTPHVELMSLSTEKIGPADTTWVHRVVPLDSIVNSAKIDGRAIDRDSISKAAKLDHAGVPFELARPDADGNDHVDIGTSWFRAGNIPGRYSGRGADSLVSRWPGALIKDHARIAVRLPMSRYSALHLLAAADSESNSAPIITAQFFRAQAGFPKNFAARVPAFSATSQAADAIPVKTSDGKGGKLYHITIPVDPSALAEFADLDYVDVELTKEVQIYRASPDPMYYSQHAAGLPSSVHLFALTAERPAIDVDLKAGVYGHIWTAPEKPEYTISLENRRGKARPVELELATVSLDGTKTSSQKKLVNLPADKEVSVTLAVAPPSHGYHTLKLTVTDAQAKIAEERSLAYLHEDTRERGDWDFGRGPLFGFWNWGGGHHTPPAHKQLLVMAKAGIESTPGSFEDYTARHGEEAKAVMEKYKIFTLKFAGAGDHYVTARFAGTLKTGGLEKAKEEFLAELNKRKSTAGPNSRPMFLSYYPEPSIGPITHGIFPQFIGEPDKPMSDYEKERYTLFLNGFVEGSKIVRENFPGVKNLLPHGDPAFAIHFLRNNPEIAKLFDGITVDIPCFERLPEQQFHQVSLHRLYMTRKEMEKAGVKNPLLPMYEGPCVPSGPGAITEQEQADITIRNSLLLLVYGVDVQNGGFPGFDTASYWGEQHYGFGVMNRLSLETPKPVYTSLATLTRHLNRANYNKWVKTGSLNTYALQFKHYRTGKLVHVMWTLRGQRPVTLTTAGAKVAVFDQNDNELPLTTRGDQVTFTIDQSPCYVEGLGADAQIALGEPDHSDSLPSEQSQKLASLGDGSWTITTQQEKEYEDSHTPYIYRYPSKMTAQAVDAPKAQGGKALAVNFPQPEKDRVFVPYYSVLKPAGPIQIPGKASHLGLWVKADGDWGRAIYFVRDAKGEQWINVGTRGSWNCDDLHSWMSFNFDGWRYLRMEMPANSPYDQYREAGNAWWGPYSSGDGNIDLPLTLEKVVVERRTHVMYVDDPQPASRSDVLLGDLYAEYAKPADATSEAVELAAVRMPVPKDVKGLSNPIADLVATGVGPAVKIERITLPNQEADGTQCYVHFPKVDGAKQYDIWVATYADGRGALNLGKAWKEPGGLVKGLRAYQDFYLFAAYTDADGKVSKPSAPYKINLEDFFGMK